MKQSIPPEKFPVFKREKGHQLLQTRDSSQFRLSQQHRYLIAAVSGLVLCALGMVYLKDSPLLYWSSEHHFDGQLFLDANGDQRHQQDEQLLPFVKLNLFSDLNDNQQLDPSDLALGSCMTDENGQYQLSIAHGRTLIARVNNPRQEMQENAVSGSIRVGEPYLQLGGDGGVNNLTSLRFEQIQIPQDAIIQQAFIRLRASAQNNEKPALWIYGAKTPLTDVSPHTQQQREFSEASVLWECGNWKKDHLYQTPDLSKVIINLLQSPDWAKHQSLTLVIDGSDGIKEAYSSAEHAPQLVIQYRMPEHPYLIQIDPSCLPPNRQPESISLPFTDNHQLQIPYAGLPPLCLALTENGRMASFNWQSGMIQAYPPDARHSIEATHLSWVGAELFGLYQGTPGKIEVPGGAFQKINIDGNWPGKSKNIIALTAHPYSGELWAIDEEAHLLRINPATASLLDYSGSYLPLPALAGQKIVQMAFHVPHQKLYALVRQPSKDLALWSISLDGEEAHEIGLLSMHNRPLQDVIGMAALANGKLMLITGTHNLPEINQNVLEIDPLQPEATPIHSWSAASSLRQCGCMLAPPHRIEGQVFHDRNANGLRDPQEMAYPNVKLQVFQDQNENNRLDPEDLLLQTLSTNTEGQFAWQNYASQTYLVELDSTTLPEGIILVSNPLLKVDFRHFLGGGNAKLLYTATQKSQLARLFWAQFDVQAQDDGVLLRWVTTREKEPGYFYILRSADGISYETIGQQIARGPSEQYQQYHFSDRGFSPDQQESAVYRIRWENIQGQTAFSDVKPFTPHQSSTDELRLEVSPGTNRPLDLRYRSLDSGKARLTVINLAGKTVFQKEMITGPDWRQFQISNHDWSSGIYYLQWEGPIESLMKKVIVQ